MLIAEDLLLLLLDDESGALSAASTIQTALGGAVLAELAVTEKVEVGERTGRWRSAKVSAVGPAPEDAVRRALTATLVEGLDPDPRTGALVALLAAVDQAHRVVEHPGMSNGEVRKRAKAVAEGEWAAKGVADAIAATNAAVMAAVTASTVAATSSAGS